MSQLLEKYKRRITKLPKALASTADRRELQRPVRLMFMIQLKILTKLLKSLRFLQK